MQSKHQLTPAPPPPFSPFGFQLESLCCTMVSPVHHPKKIKCDKTHIFSFFVMPLICLYIAFINSRTHSLCLRTRATSLATTVSRQIVKLCSELKSMCNSYVLSGTFSMNLRRALPSETHQKYCSSISFLSPDPWWRTSWTSSPLRVPQQPDRQF